jgi:molybdopterin-guanine dinucleotide biosynthesis protein A
MGRDKALIELNRRPLVMRVTDRLWACADDVFVVAKDPEDFDRLGLRWVPDGAGAQTPLAGILGALRAAKHDHVFVCACDMPFVSPDVVRLIASRGEGFDAAVPQRDGRPEPLHAVWSANAGDRVDAALQEGETAVHRALEKLRVAWIDEDEWRSVDPRGRSFVNINTPSDLSALRRLSP